ncbi:hypothetical protein M0R45_005368 [Rubus argutus]|uniref:1-acylglycerol-3-phosphate O-acyltransferase n=1 Tax=Rubus argutus TaxID=59490 RepID=A0AAW1YMB0_RUBAR
MIDIVADAVLFSFVLFFVISGLTVNLIQAICFVVIRPLSKNIHRRINGVVAELLWLEVGWLFDWWAGVEVQVYTDKTTMAGLMSKENAIVISNNITNIDFISVLARRSGSSSLVVCGKLLKFFPVIGWAMWFSENIFVESNYYGSADQGQALAALHGIKDFPWPIWLRLFPQETENGEVMTEVFVSAVKHMRSFVPAVYDVTVAFPESCSNPPPTAVGLVHERLRQRQPYVVHVHIKRHDLRNLPWHNGRVAKWCEHVFVAKNALLDHHRAHQTFGDKVQLLETCSGKRRPLKSLLVVTCWALVFVFWTIKFPLLSLLVLLIASSCVALILELHRLASVLLNLTAFLLRRAFGSQVTPLLLVTAAYFILP